MAERICNEPGCHLPHMSKGMCRLHYGAAYRRAKAKPKQLELPLAIHSLTHVDLERRTAHCSMCGPVAVRIKKPGSKHVECEVKRAADKTRRSTPEAWRRQRLRGRYGMTVEEYEQRFSDQGGVCAICGEASTSRLAVDHDHTTGMVRDLLCKDCNLAIGFLRDNATFARAAAVYLERHQMAS